MRGSLFKLNRYTPEAQSNQLKWAREQMDLEVPEATADGDSIADREDFINKYMASERSKFGREIDRATAEAEVDEWLLKQATFAPAKTRYVLAGRAPCEEVVPSSPSVRAPEPSSQTCVHRLALARPRHLTAARISRSPCSSSWPPLAASYTLQASSMTTLDRVHNQKDQSLHTHDMCLIVSVLKRASQDMIATCPLSRLFSPRRSLHTLRGTGEAPRGPRASEALHRRKGRGRERSAMGRKRAQVGQSGPGLTEARAAENNVWTTRT